MTMQTTALPGRQTAWLIQPANPTKGVLAERVKTFTGWQPGVPEPAECRCDHKLQGTGAVFYQSVGILHCVGCGGYQLIRKPVE